MIHGFYLGFGMRMRNVGDFREVIGVMIVI